MKLSKNKLKNYQMYLADKYPLCQIRATGCTVQVQDTHHLFYGCFGADKDDTSLICVCRNCHEWAHKNKKLSQKVFSNRVKKNWDNFLKEELCV
jgi:hypothetical protein